MTPADPVEGPDVAELRKQLTGALGDDYTLGAVLGSGRCGVVFLARNVKANRDVAIKVAWNEPAARAQLARETSLTSEVVHPHVLGMRKLYLAKPIFVIEMPIAPGGTLDDLLVRRSGTPASFQYVRGLLRQMASAFDEAHAQGIVHGTLCPAKILLDENGQCLISDFGLRLPLRPNAARPSELGAAPYTPTEQRHDRADVDGRVDQYALGIIAYELLRGRRRWRITSEGVLEIDPLDVPVNRPIAPGVPPSAAIAIKRATAREPAHRFSSIGEFVVAFSGDTPDAVATHPRRRRRIKFRRSWLLAPVVLVLGIVVSRPSVRGTLRGLMPTDWSFLTGVQSDEDQPPAVFPDTAPLTAADTGRRSGGDVAPRQSGRAGLTTGVIDVTLSGGSSAFVVIDGQTRGGTPLSWRADAGRHVVSLRGEFRYSPSSISVNVAGGDTAHAAFTVAGPR